MDTQSELKNSKEIILYLSQQFPKCFIIEGDAKPLKIGIFQDLVARLADNDKLSKTKLRAALRSYTMSWRYLYSIKEGANRVDLDGNPCEEITAQHVEHAQQQLKESKDKVKAKRIAEGKTNDKVKMPRNKPAKIANKPNSSKKTSSTKVKVNKPMAKVDLAGLKSGDKVNVILGSSPISATILSIEKENIRVKIPSGMELTVTSEHIIAN